MKHDEMTDGKKQKKVHTSKKSKKDAMCTDEMKNYDNMKQNEAKRQHEERRNAALIANRRL